jgi:ribosomal protein S2
VIPGNDDAIRSCALVVRAIAEGIAAGRQKASPADFAPAEAQPPQEEAEATETAAQDDADAAVATNGSTRGETA